MILEMKCSICIFPLAKHTHAKTTTNTKHTTHINPNFFMTPTKYSNKFTNLKTCIYGTGASNIAICTKRISNQFFKSIPFKTLTKREKREKEIGARTCTSMFCSTTTYQGPWLFHLFPLQSHFLPFGMRIIKPWRKITSSSFLIPNPRRLGLSLSSTKATFHNNRNNTSNNCKPPSKRTKLVQDWTKVVTCVFKWFGTNKLFLILKV